MAPDADDEYQKVELGGSVGRKASRECRHGNHSLCSDPVCQCRHHGRVEGDVQTKVGIGEADYEGPVIDFKADGQAQLDLQAAKQAYVVRMAPAELANGGVDVYRRWAEDIAQRSGQRAGQRAEVCPQCGKPYEERACGPTHANERREEMWERRLQATKDALAECLKAQVDARESARAAVDQYEERMGSRLVKVVQELEATQRAKRENDERFQLEAQTQRERADHLVVQRDALRTALEKSREQNRKLRESAQADALTYEEKQDEVDRIVPIPQEPK